MKRTTSWLLAICGLLFTVACNTGSGGDPKAVAKKFFEALQQQNFVEAEKYATKESKDMLNLMKMGVAMAPNADSATEAMKKMKIDYSNPVVNGNEATVSITVDGKKETSFKLKKEEGDWKVAFDKGTLMQIGMEKAKEEGASEQEMQQAEEALKMLSSDSMKKITGEALKDASGVLDSLSKKIDK